MPADHSLKAPLLLPRARQWGLGGDQTVLAQNPLDGGGEVTRGVEHSQEGCAQG